MAREIRTELRIPHGKEPRDAKNITLTLREGSLMEEGYSVTINLQLTESLQLMRQLADALNSYRTSMQEHYSNGIEHAVKELEGMFE